MEKRERNRIRIGLIMDQINEACQASILAGANDYANQNDLDLMVFVANTIGERNNFTYNYDVLQHFICEDNLDGLVIMTGAICFYYSAEEVTNFFSKFHPIPMVSVAGTIQGTTNILMDNKHGTMEMAEHLIEKHHCRKIAFVKGPENHDEADKRFLGYKEALEKYSIPYDENLVIPGEFTWEGGVEAAKVILEHRKLDIDAIVCADDETALGVLAVLKEKGINVPYDIALTGFDDTDEAASCTPSLTTVKQRLSEQGKMAVRICFDIIQGKLRGGKDVYLPVSLAIRQSCGCFSIMDSHGQVGGESSTSECYLGIDDTGFRDETINKLQFDLKDHEIDEENKQRWLQYLIDSFFEFMEKDEAEAKFIQALNEILHGFSKYSEDVTVWVNVILSLKKCFLNYYGNKGNKYKLEYVILRARSFINEVSFSKKYSNKKKTKNISWLLRIIGQGLNTTLDMEGLLKFLEKGLEKLEIEGFYICLFDYEKGEERNIEKKLPARSKLIFAYKGFKRISINPEGIIFPTKELLPDVKEIRTKRETLIYMSLYFGEESLGFIIYEYANNSNFIYEVLQNYLGMALKGSLLYNERTNAEVELKNVLDRLEKANSELKNLSLKDELTALYNRKGFFMLAEKHFQIAKKLEKDSILFFIDIDDLKVINDHFGHKEGDLVLKGCADILRKTFRKIDIIARIGDDEYTALVVNAAISDCDAIIQRIHSNVDEYNMNLGKPYKLSLSLGYSYATKGCSCSFEEFILEADRNLSENKNTRK
ncbi:MAG: GGDEF domain-containing protein [Clostridia bacterium]|nr:GGDEF domain-containing protein [Clostridia bacterium]